MSNRVITITFGDQAENHAGMQKIGNLADKGLSVDNLKEIRDKYFTNFKTELVELSRSGEKDMDPAAVLVVRNYSSEDLFHEMRRLKWDKKAKMYGRVVNKHARWNLCFSDFDQEPDYNNGKGRVVNFAKISELRKIRKFIGKILSETIDYDKLPEAEGNYYYDTAKCGIGYHGDAERKIVVAVRCSDNPEERLPIYYQWYKNSKPVGEKIQIELGNDLYFMSEKATGNDWKKKNIYTLRHATGAKKFTLED